MNKIIYKITVFVTLIVANHIALLWLPWYMILPVTALVVFIFGLKPATGLLYGFLALFSLWTILPLLTDISNNYILSNRIGELFGGLSSYMLWIVTGIIGGIGGLLGGWFGGLLASITSKKS